MATFAAYFVAFVFLLGIPLLIWKDRRSSRYSGMSEKDFEREAARSGRISAAVLSFQKIVDASHSVEYMQQEDKHVEAQTAESGDQPIAGLATGGVAKFPSKTD